MRSAEYNYDGGFYRDSINRAYYVVFYAINKNYVATGIFPRDVGKYLGRIKLKREEGDYTDFYIASETEAKEQIDRAKYILETIENYLKDKL